MRNVVRGMRGEFAPMVRLAMPLALAELSWMTMGIADTLMAAPLGAAAVGATTLGNMIYYPVVVTGIGLLLGMDTLVAQSFGAQEHDDCRRTLVAGMWMGLLMTPPLMVVILASIPLLGRAGVNPQVMEECAPYMRALIWSIPAMAAFTALRRYLQAVDVVKPVTFALVSANAVNLLGNWMLIYGHWGAPRMGLTGSAWSTSLSRVYMAAVLAGAVWWNERREGSRLLELSWRPDFERMRRLLALGLPAAGQIGFEGSIFGLVTVLVARLDAASLAAHSIAVQVISISFMAPLGISSAAAVRVGQAVGRKDGKGAACAGWTALLLSALFMGSVGLVLWIAPGAVVRLFIRDAAVIASGAVLLRIAALFELFDGFQVVATGALRGLGDTRSPMLTHLVGYWGVGMPVGCVLCFGRGWGAQGIWIGLCLAIILIGATLVAVWWKRAER